MRRLLAWLRFRGWRNSFWRLDWYMSRCPHAGLRYHDLTTGWTLCVDCGQPVRDDEG
jgi:hypothetical protein